LKKTIVAPVIGLLLLVGCSSSPKVEGTVVSSTVVTRQSVDCSDLSKKAAENKGQHLFSDEEFEKILVEVIKACVARQNR
jgi:uncharacterized protein YcfL